MQLEALPLALVLLAALMHAGWNLIAKLGSDRLVAMALIKAPVIPVSLAVIAVTGPPAIESWPYLLGSTTVNCLYFYFLINAYRTGDLSLAYPVARGLAPLLVLGLGWVAAGEAPSAPGLAGVTLICVSILALGFERGAGARHYQTLWWAGGVGLCIAIYTVTDGIGGRLSGNPIGYVAVLNVLTGIAVCGVAAWRRGPALRDALRTGWRQGALGGVMMLAGYTIVVYAMTLAPMAQVAALRESSVIIAALLGAIFLHEPFGAKRVAAATGVAAGIAILILAR